MRMFKYGSVPGVTKGKDIRIYWFHSEDVILDFGFLDDKVFQALTRMKPKDRADELIKAAEGSFIEYQRFEDDIVFYPCRTRHRDPKSGDPFENIFFNLYKLNEEEYKKYLKEWELLDDNSQEIIDYWYTDLDDNIIPDNGNWPDGADILHVIAPAHPPRFLELKSFDKLITDYERKWMIEFLDTDVNNSHTDSAQSTPMKNLQKEINDHENNTQWYT